MKPFDVYAGRLLILCAYLDGLKPGRFNFRSFVGRDWKGAQDLSCGCTACGMGHAVALFGEMCDVELVLFGPYEQAIPRIKGTLLHDPNAMMLEAAERMFNITVERDFDHLFIPAEDRDDEREVPRPMRGERTNEACGTRKRTLRGGEPSRSLSVCAEKHALSVRR